MTLSNRQKKAAASRKICGNLGEISSRDNYKTEIKKIAQKVD